MADTQRISQALEAEASRERALEDGYATLAASRHQDQTERRAIREHALNKA